MGRPSSLSDARWDELFARLARGEKAAVLAREYGVSKTAVSLRLSKRKQTVEAVANQVVAADQAFRSLPIADQFVAATIIDDLKAVSAHLASTAKFNSASAHRLAALANAQLEKVDPVDPMASMDTLRTHGALVELSNKAATVGLNLLAANKKTVERINDTPPEERLSIEEYLAARERVLSEI